MRLKFSMKELPNLFKENSGVVATGYLDKERKIFIANEILS